MHGHRTSAALPSLASANWRTLAILGLAVSGGGLTAALVALGRTSLPGISLQWALLALVVAAALSALAAIQSLLLFWTAGRTYPAALGTVARSFAPLLVLWPLYLLVTFWDLANHVFVFFPASALYWGGVGFVFVLIQIALLPVQLDAPTDLRRWLRTGLVGLRQASLNGPHAFPIVLLAFVGLRLSVRFAFDLALRLDRGPPFELFYRLATLTDQGVYPYLQRWSEYPPGFPWLSAGVFRAVSFFGVDWERYYLALTLVLLVFGAGTLVLLYKTAELVWDRRRAVQAAWLYTALAMPAHEMLRVFEEFPIFFLMLATYLLVSNRRHTGALALTLGALVKLMPLAVGPALLRYSAHARERLRLLLIGAVLAAGVLVPLWWFGRVWFEASLGNMLARPPWETVWALLDGYLGAGLVPDYRLNPDLATAYDRVGRLPGWFWPLLPVALAAFYAYILLMRRVRQDARGKVAFVLLSLVALQLALKGFSPQFILWLVPLILVLRPDGRGFALVLALTLLEQFRWGIYGGIGQPPWWMVLTVSLRTLAQIAIGVWAFRIVRSLGPQSPARGIPTHTLSLQGRGPG